MIRFVALLGLSSAVVGCGGGPGAAAPPSPKPTRSEPAPTAPVSGARVQYHLREPLAYEVLRYDSLFFAGAGAGAPQITGRQALVTVRPDGGRLQISLDSVTGVLGARLARSSIDSALGARWETRITSAGIGGQLRGTRNTVLLGQIGAAVRLLFPQLPSNGARAEDAWSDSTGYQVRLDAFEASESAARSSRAVAGAAPGGVRLEVIERLSRSGSATQGGRVMTLAGSGGRQATYEFAPEGWVTFLHARDSLDLQVTIADAAQIIPVRWRTTVIARLRGTPVN